MADNPSSADKYPQGLELLANFLREHEKKLDSSIDELANIIEQMRPTENLIRKISDLEEKVDELQKQISCLNQSLGKPKHS